jgi:hypothetical protein
MKKAKVLAASFIQDDFDILNLPDFIDYWNEQEGKKTRPILSSTNVRLALNQANEMNLLATETQQNFSARTEEAKNKEPDNINTCSFNSCEAMSEVERMLQFLRNLHSTLAICSLFNTPLSNF